MSQKRKLVSLSLKEKKDLISLFEKENVTKTAFAKKHGIARTTLNDILSSKESLEDIDCNDKKRKRMRKSKFQDLEEVLRRWIIFVRSVNMPISALILKETALDVAKELNVENFNASNGWIERFKERHNLSFRKVNRESANDDVNVFENWKSNILKDILTRYSDTDVFNLAETGLFYRILPDKTLAFKDEKCTDGKLSKQRLTILLGANMSGTEKIKPLVIGKRKQPRCFLNVKSLPVDYESNSNAWMSSEIWEKHIRQLDEQFLHKKRKVAFIVDNCTVHTHIENLKAIEMVFLPPNVTALLPQPLDQGVIHEFKHGYRKLLIKDLLKAINKNEKLEVSVLNAINYIHKCWDLVSEKIVKNCFKHAGFVSDEEQDEATNRNYEYEVENENFGSEFENLYSDSDLSNLPAIVNESGCTVLNISDYMNIDNNLAVCSQDTIKNLTMEYLEENCASASDESGNEEISSPPNKTEALGALEIMRHFLTSVQGTTEDEFRALNVLEKKVNCI